MVGTYIPRTIVIVHTDMCRSSKIKKPNTTETIYNNNHITKPKVKPMTQSPPLRRCLPLPLLPSLPSSAIHIPYRRSHLSPLSCRGASHGVVQCMPKFPLTGCPIGQLQSMECQKDHRPSRWTGRGQDQSEHCVS